MELIEVLIVRKSVGKSSVEDIGMRAGGNGSYTWYVMEMAHERANTAGACNNRN